MTRSWTETPIWAWSCDTCGIEHPVYVRHAENLPSVTEMQALGWHIADVYGDMCPTCVLGAAGLKTTE